jgi:hypothetical protein
MEICNTQIDFGLLKLNITWGKTLREGILNDTSIKRSNNG